MGPNRSDHRSNYIEKMETIKQYLCITCIPYVVHIGDIERTFSFSGGGWIALHAQVFWEKDRSSVGAEVEMWL
jgi:hypothetical protein